jgi:hypothetical protein
MSDLNNNNTKFNLPSYINIPFFLYQDNRLEKSALLIAAFFYSLHTSGKSITASISYLCNLASIQKRQYYKILNSLESLGYIKRTGFTNKRKTIWIYNPTSEIIIDETDSSPQNPKDKKPIPKHNKEQVLNTSALQDTKLVHSRTLNLCTPVHTYNKEDNKDYKTTTTVDKNETSPKNEDLSSSSFFSEKQKAELISFKIDSDDRPNNKFLAECEKHIEMQDNEYSNFQRYTGLKNILLKLYELKEAFYAKGTKKEEKIKEQLTTPPTKEDFENYKKCITGYDWVGAWMQKQKAQ